MADLLINGKDAKIMGVRMGHGFINELMTPYPLKDAITNESRLEDGRRVLKSKGNGKRFKNYRELTLTFIVEGVNSITFFRNLQRFESLLYEGEIEIEVPSVYRKHRLNYQKSNSFARTYDNTFCKVMVKFTEDFIDEQKEIKGSYNKSYNKSYR